VSLRFSLRSTLSVSLGLALTALTVPALADSLPPADCSASTAGASCNTAGATFNQSGVCVEQHCSRVGAVADAAVKVVDAGSYVCVVCVLAADVPGSGGGGSPYDAGVVDAAVDVDGSRASFGAGSGSGSGQGDGGVGVSFAPAGCSTVPSGGTPWTGITGFLTGLVALVWRVRRGKRLPSA